MGTEHSTILTVILRPDAPAPLTSRLIQELEKRTFVSFVAPRDSISTRELSCLKETQEILGDMQHSLTPDLPKAAPSSVFDGQIHRWRKENNLQGLTVVLHRGMPEDSVLRVVNRLREVSIVSEVSLVPALGVHKLFAAIQTHKILKMIEAEVTGASPRQIATRSVGTRDWKAADMSGWGGTPGAPK